MCINKHPTKSPTRKYSRMLQCGFKKHRRGLRHPVLRAASSPTVPVLSAGAVSNPGQRWNPLRSPAATPPPLGFGHTRHCGWRKDPIGGTSQFFGSSEEKGWNCAVAFPAAEHMIPRSDTLLSLHSQLTEIQAGIACKNPFRSRSAGLGKSATWLIPSSDLLVRPRSVAVTWQCDAWPPRWPLLTTLGCVPTAKGFSRRPAGGGGGGGCVARVWAVFWVCCSWRHHLFRAKAVERSRKAPPPQSPVGVGRSDVRVFWRPAVTVDEITSATVPTGLAVVPEFPSPLRSLWPLRFAPQASNGNSFSDVSGWHVRVPRVRISFPAPIQGSVFPYWDGWWKSVKLGILRHGRQVVGRSVELCPVRSRCSLHTCRSPALGCQTCWTFSRVENWRIYLRFKYVIAKNINATGSLNRFLFLVSYSYFKV